MATKIRLLLMAGAMLAAAAAAQQAEKESTPKDQTVNLKQTKESSAKGQTVKMKQTQKQATAEGRDATVVFHQAEKEPVKVKDAGYSPFRGKESADKNKQGDQAEQAPKEGAPPKSTPGETVHVPECKKDEVVRGGKCTKVE